MATGGSSSQAKPDGQRVVLLGKKGAGKSSLANRILGHEIFKTEEIGLCIRRQGEHAGRKLTVVDTPGWDRVSVLRTPEKIKQEIIQSATLCLPGPHALILVLPISMNDQIPSANEFKSASHHVALLSNRARRHTIVLFVCKDEMDTSAIDQHVQGAKKLIDKCEGRFFILQNDSDVTALLQKIEDMVEENHGDFLKPKVSYEESEKRMQSGTGLDYREQLGKQEQETNYDNTGGTTKRNDSKESSPPTTTETSQGRAAVQDQDSDKETGAENEESEKNISSGTAEQTEKYEKRVEELKQQHKTECEKMEQNFREKLEELVNDYKSGVTSKRRNSNEFSPPNMAETSQGGAAVQDQDSVKEMGAEKEKPEKNISSGTAEQIEKYEKRIKKLQQLFEEESDKMELGFREQFGKLEQEMKIAGTSQGRAAFQHLAFNEPFCVVMMAFFGALVGSIVGATDGVQGSAGGVIFGSTIGVVLAILYIRLTRFL